VADLYQVSTRASRAVLHIHDSAGAIFAPEKSVHFNSHAIGMRFSTGQSNPDSGRQQQMSRLTNEASSQQAKEPCDICDRATLEELRADGLLPDLIRIFQTELAKALDELANALAQNDCAVVARVAHTLKGTAGTFGAIRMHQMSAGLDQAARANQVEHADAMFGEFRSECERVRDYLAAELEK
jgi:histidine phosphotransfer protein HptB